MRFGHTAFKNLLFFVVASLVWFLSHAQPPEEDQLEIMDNTACIGNDEIVIDGRVIRTDTIAIRIEGNCDVKITNCRIISEDIAVRLYGNGKLYLENSLIQGAAAAVRVSGNAEFSYRNSIINGEVVISGEARMLDLGGNAIVYEPETQQKDISQVSTTQQVSKDEVTSIEHELVSLLTEGMESESLESDGISPEIDAELVNVDDANLETQIEKVSIQSYGKVNINGTITSVVVDDGWVRIGNKDNFEHAADWRVAANGNYSQSDIVAILQELNAREEKDGIRVDLAGDILFDFDQAEIKNDAVTTLSKLAHVLREKANEVMIIGHTDSIGTEDYNRTLSDRRALSVMFWLNQRENIPAYLMKAQGMGAQIPVALNKNPDGSDIPEGRAKNRRVEIKIIVNKN